MKKKLITAIAFLCAFAVGCVLGAIAQHLRGGYWHNVLKTQSFPFAHGEVTLSYTAESIGMPFLDPETSVLTVETKYGLPITQRQGKTAFPPLKGTKRTKERQGQNDIFIMDGKG